MAEFPDHVFSLLTIWTIRTIRTVVMNESCMTESLSPLVLHLQSW